MQVLVTGLVDDALAVLAAVQDVEVGAEQAEAAALLALVAGQDVEAGQRSGTWRVARRVARDQVVSTVDPRPAIPARPARTSGTATGHVVTEPSQDCSPPAG